MVHVLDPGEGLGFENVASATPDLAVPVVKPKGGKGRFN